MKFFDAFKPFLNPDMTPPPDKLRPIVDEARRVRDTTAAEIAELEGARRAMLTADEPVRAKHKRSLAEAQDRLADAELYVVELQAKLAEALSAEAEAGRREVYKSAAAKASAAAGRLSKEYARHAGAIRDVICAIAEAELAVNAANADLPCGAAPLVGPERIVRDGAASPRTIIGDTIVKLWVYPGTGNVLPPEAQATVRQNGASSKGSLPSQSKMGDPFKEVELRSFRRIEFRPEVRADHARALARSVELPGLRAGEPPFWSSDAGDPSAVLRRADSLKAAALAKPPADVRVELIPYVEGSDASDLSHTQAA